MNAEQIEDLTDDGVDDSFERGTVILTPEEKEAREREKAQLLEGHVIRGESSPRARRIRPGQEHDYPDQVAQHLPDVPSREELQAESQRAAEPARATRVPGMQNTIEALAAQVREDEARLKESKALLKRALKRLGVK